MDALLYRLWGKLPAWCQELFVYLGSPKVTLGVSAIIVDPQGRVLLVHHTYRQPAWGFPSGLVGRSEQPGVALAREIHEEMGLAATIGPLLYANRDARRRHLTLYYRVEVTGTPRSDVDEIDAHRYATWEDLHVLLPAPLPAWLNDIRDLTYGPAR